MTVSDYYNDNDPGAAAWLEALAAESEIPAGTVDSRSILDVRADELSGFRRVHFFAGIGGWAEALRIARWLMGYRAVWGFCGDMAMRSIRGSRQRSSKPSPDQSST